LSIPTRKPVDYSGLTRLLTQLRANSEWINPQPERFLGDPADGAMKMFVTSRLLDFRNQNRTLFERGEYIPLSTGGASGDHVISFARREQNQAVIAVATRFFARAISERDRRSVGKRRGDTSNSNDELTGCYRDALTS
jgi:(1->4)-alpha-D-glucan 1-alpha-D-glucosylmutase